MDHKTRMLERDHARAREIRHVTWVGFWLNVLLSGLKIFAGWYGNSRAVLADGVHSLSDLVTDIAVLVGVRFWMAPPDDKHQYGYKRLESLISFFVGAVLALAGLGIACDAVSRLWQPRPESVGSPLALCAALISVVSKEILYRWTIKRGRELKSDALEANAWHHRSDAASSVPVFIALGVAMCFPSLSFLDMVGAIVVSAFILRAAWKICTGAAHVLVDGGSGAEVNGRIAEFVRGIEGVKDVHRLRTRFLGQGLQIDMHVCVDAEMSVRDGNIIAHCVEDALYTGEAADFVGVEILEALVHVDPWLPDETGVR